MKLFEKVTPESVGIPSSCVEKFIRILDKRGLATHSVLLMRGNAVFGEFYWKPFHQELGHRMYSETKSFVSIAIGILIGDGMLSLDDKVVNYFMDRCDRALPEFLKNVTVRDMLIMETCGTASYWFKQPEKDRVRLYLNTNTADVPPGMRFNYDSNASQVLCTLVEKLTGKLLFEFLNERIFSHIGTFKQATILHTKNEDSWGDSALVCTTRDIASFARVLMNHGRWEGKQLIPEEYIIAATNPQVDCDELGFDDIDCRGYGYQIWCLENGGFYFNGMGAQFTFCLPEYDLIFAITSDNQGYPAAKSLIWAAFEDTILDNLSDAPLLEDPIAYESLQKTKETLELMHLKGPRYAPGMQEVNGVRYICRENQTGIREFSFTFENDTGILHYVNDQGKKELLFGLGKNVFGIFPQYGYSNEHGGSPAEEPEFTYKCAASASWREDRKLLLKVQIIDKYLGNMLAMFSFRENIAVVRMSKTAENFLDEYVGEFIAERA